MRGEAAALKLHPEMVLQRRQSRQLRFGVCLQLSVSLQLPSYHRLRFGKGGASGHIQLVEVAELGLENWVQRKMSGRPPIMRMASASTSAHIVLPT